MTLNMEVTPETHVKLQENAQRQGQTLDQYPHDFMKGEVEPEGTSVAK
jgi:predicted HicB family RNase H-like nuclease